MVVRHYVEGYENFRTFMKQFEDKNDIIHVYFTGSKLPSGESWCEDCNKAAPSLEKALEKLGESTEIVIVSVGDRPTWKDTGNAFRKDKNTKLMVIPTILRWKHPQRLEGDQCEKAELLEMLFTDEDA